MRTLYGISRRSFLVRAFAFCTALVQGGWTRPGAARAETDYFTGTDHPLDLGKTPRRISRGEFTAY